MAKKKQADIRESWKPSEGINWDIIQRMRFMNADAEIAPGDSFTMRLKDGDEFKVRKNSTSGDDDSLMNIIYGNKD